MRSASAASTLGWKEVRIAFVEKFVCAPAPFQSPRTGFGSSVALIVEVLADAVEQPARDPELVRDLERAHRADLELPLAGHDLGVDAGDAQAGVEAGVEVRFDHRAAEDLVGADAAVVAALRRGEAVLGEAQGPRAVEEGVLLLDAEPVLVALRPSRPPRRRRRGCWSGAASCLAAAPRTSPACCRPCGSGPGQTDTGLRTQSERSPGAWFVEEPSKPQIGGAAPSSTTLVFERSFAVGTVPSIQMYSALYGKRASSVVRFRAWRHSAGPRCRVPNARRLVRMSVPARMKLMPGVLRTCFRIDGNQPIFGEMDNIFVTGDRKWPRSIASGPNPSDLAARRPLRPARRSVRGSRPRPG